MSISPKFSQTQDASPLPMSGRLAHESIVCLPRLMNAKQAAAYLGYKSVEVLNNISVKPIKLAEHGPGSAPRFDRVALDLYLDSLSNIDGRKEPMNVEDEAESAFAKWELSRAIRH